MTKEEFNKLKEKYNSVEYGNAVIIITDYFPKRLIIAVRYSLYLCNYKHQFLEITKDGITVYGVNGDVITNYNAYHLYGYIPEFKVEGKNVDEVNFLLCKTFRYYSLHLFKLVFSSGVKNLVKELRNNQICPTGLYRAFFWDSCIDCLTGIKKNPNIESLFHLKPRDLRELVENYDVNKIKYYTPSTLKLLKKLFNNSVKDICKYLNIVPEVIGDFNIESCLLESKQEQEEMRRVLRYYISLYEYSSSFPNTLNIYLDYKRMRGLLDVDIQKKYPIYPQNFSKIQALHNEVLYLFNKEQERIRLAKQAERQQTYLDKYYNIAKKLELADDIYSIIAVKELGDLIKEGRALNHCVGSYIDSVSEGKEYILFLRKNEDIDTPYFTIDVTPNMRVRQIHGSCNCNISKEIRPFIKKWANKFGLDISNCSGVYVALR